MEQGIDPFQLTRFIRAQERDYSVALSELRRGRKNSHWMWYVFPQFTGLGRSPTAELYAIKSLAEAQAYLEHPVLGARLLECSKQLLAVDGRTAYEIFGSPDDLKLRSCATLFAHLSPAGSIFEQVLDEFFGGNPDDRTIELLAEQ